MIDFVFQYNCTMNYAEDRLDRRARSSNDAEGGAATTSGSLDQDLNRAHKVLHCADYNRASLSRDLAETIARLCVGDTNKIGTTPVSTNVSPEKALQLLSTVNSLRELRAAHEHAGMTLRDRGSNRSAVFHFGMAWQSCHWIEKIKRVLGVNCHDSVTHGDQKKSHQECEWRSVGDYAQMAEFAGFPEVGVLALLLYRAGGSLKLPVMTTAPSAEKGNNNCGGEENQTKTTYGCGCGIIGCGVSSCYLPFSSTSRHISRILEAFDSVKQSGNVDVEDNIFPSASDVLAQIAVMSRKPHFADGPMLSMNQFLMRRIHLDVPSILQFWDEGSLTVNPSPLTTDVSPECLRTFPCVLKLLLVKLLYSSPLSGSFLCLACYSISYLAAVLPPSSKEGRELAKDFKSHWAYFVFIRSLVLGERVKKHRVDRNTCQSPVWDEVLLKPDDFRGGKNWRNVATEYHFHQYLQNILEKCEKMEILSPHQFQCSLPSVIIYHPTALSTPYAPLYVVGDSHVLSLAWQTICIDLSEQNLGTEGGMDKVYRTAFPFPATGIKAWHFRSSTQFFTHYNLHALLQRLPVPMTKTDSAKNRVTIILSAGEIDCREGIGGALLQGYYTDCNDAVERTVTQYLRSVSEIAEEYNLQVLLMPVAPHAYRSEKNGKALGRAKRRHRCWFWNEILRRNLKHEKARQLIDSPNHHYATKNSYNNVFLLDYEEKLRHPDRNSPVGYVLNRRYNADYTHVNSAIVPLLERSILESGCDMTLI